MFSNCSNCLEGICLHNKTSILRENHKIISRIKQFRNRDELNRKFRNKKGVVKDKIGQDNGTREFNNDRILVGNHIEIGEIGLRF